MKKDLNSTQDVELNFFSDNRQAIIFWFLSPEYSNNTSGIAQRYGFWIFVSSEASSYSPGTHNSSIHRLRRIVEANKIMLSWAFARKVDIFYRVDA